jgi:hypothetical protein
MIYLLSIKCYILFFLKRILAVSDYFIFSIIASTLVGRLSPLVKYPVRQPRSGLRTPEAAFVSGPIGLRTALTLAFRLRVFLLLEKV